MTKQYVWQPKTQRLEDDLRDREYLLELQRRISSGEPMWRYREPAEPEMRAYTEYAGDWQRLETPELYWMSEEERESAEVKMLQFEKEAKSWMPWVALGAAAPSLPSGAAAFGAAGKIPWAGLRWPAKGILGAVYPEVPLKGAMQYLSKGAQAGVGKLVSKAVSLLPEKTLTRPLASEPQQSQIMQLLKEKNFINKAGKYTQSVRNLVVPLTKAFGTKRTTQKLLNSLTDDQAATMIEMLGKLEPGAKVPKNVALMPTELMELIPSFKEISILDKVRQVPYVLRKIGLWRVWEDFIEMDKKRMQDVIGFRKIAQYWDDFIRKGHPKDYKVSKERIFDALENPIETHKLDPQEQEAFIFLKGFFDDWADKLGVPASKRVKNYITHIFDETHRRIYTQHRSIDPDLLAAMEFIKPKTVSMPFLRERGGMRAGLVKEPFKVAEIYNSYAARRHYWQPILTKVRTYMDYVPPNAQKYLRGFANRLAGRPTPLDAEANQFVKELAQISSKFLPKSIANQFQLAAQTRNLAALFAHNYTGVLYMSWLGLRPVSAIRNLSQNILTVAEVGCLDFARGLKIQLTPAAKKAFEQSYIRLSREFSYLPGLEQGALAQFPTKVQQFMLAMFRGADRVNVRNAFHAGYAQGKRLKLPDEWCIRLGDEVALKTQYLYSRMGRSMVEEHAAGRFLTPLTSWPRNFMELFADWVQGRQSMTLKSYMEQTGKKLAIPEKSRKQLLTYMMLLAGAYGVQGTTAIRATEYVGWRSWNTLASLISGDVPGLEWIGGLANIVAGAVTLDDKLIKKGWQEVRPDRFVTILRQINQIARGDADWLSLFFYLQQQELEEAKGKEKYQFPRPPAKGREPLFERGKVEFKRK